MYSSRESKGSTLCMHMTPAIRHVMHLMKSCWERAGPSSAACSRNKAHSSPAATGENQVLPADEAGAQQAAEGLLSAAKMKSLRYSAVVTCIGDGLTRTAAQI